MSLATKNPFYTIGSVNDLVSSLKEQGKKIVVTQGVYDLLHIGHINYLQKAKDLGDCLIVGVDSDEYTKIRKGKHRPIVPQDERIAMLLALRAVDYVVLREAADDKDDLVKIIKPDVLVISNTTNDYPNFEATIREKLSPYCGDIACFEPQATTSTTNRIREIVQAGSIDAFVELGQDLSAVFKKHGILFKNENE